MNPLLLAIAANTIEGRTLDQVITTPGAGTWTPPAWLIGQDITVQCWGAGANGADYGGGGGEFAQSNFTVTGDVEYRIGSDGGIPFTAWDYSTSDNPYANNGSGQTGGTGGTGTITYDGGNGGDATAGGTIGGGGGGGAGSSDVGGAGVDDVGGTGGTGINPGGNGGNGASLGDGQTGFAPGGGGGGTGEAGSSGGAGANGQIRIIYPAL